MPADSYAAAIPVGELSRGRASGARGEQGSGTQNPSLRGSVAAQGNRIDDTTLIREAQRGNRAAFEVLVRHYDQSVLRLALHLTGSEADAQDIHQEVSALNVRSIPGFIGSSPTSVSITCASEMYGRKMLRSPPIILVKSTV